MPNLFNFVKTIMHGGFQNADKELHKHPIYGSMSLPVRKYQEKALAGHDQLKD